MGYHKDLSGNNLHAVHRWEFNDETARLAASGLLVGDLGKIAWQKDNNTFWALINNSPTTWVSIVIDEAHRSLTNNPHSVTKSDVALSDVPNTNFTTPVSDNTTHRGLTNNPHTVTKSDVGLGSVPNTNFTTPVGSNTTHRGLTTGNPHSVDKVDVALGSVPNTDFTIPVSDNTTHRGLTNNPHSVDKVDVALSDVPNTDFTTPVGDNTTHRNSTSNPHSVDKSDVGLGTVPNTDFTVSVGDNTTHRGLTTGNPHSVTIDDIGLDLSAIDEDIIPDGDNTRSLGSATKAWKDVYVGPGSFYVNNQKVVEDDSGTIVLSADEDQNVQLQSKGSGDIELLPVGTGVIQMKGNFSVLASKNIMSSDGNAINYSDGIAMNGNKLSGLPTPATDSEAATKVFVETYSANASNLSSGTIPSSVLPPIALVTVQLAASEVAMLALTTEEGDVVVRTDEDKSYMHNDGSAGTMADFNELQTPTDIVLSVNGATGSVILTKSDVGLGSVPNTNFTTPVSDNTTHRGLTTGNPHTVTKSDVALGSVPNTDFTTPVGSNTTHRGSDGKDHSDVVTNNAKVSNVSTNLTEGTSTQTTVNVNSSDGSNATLVSASVSRAGLLTKAKFDEITTNTLKVSDINHNTTTNITVVEAPTNVNIQSSDGLNDTIAAANGINAGVMTTSMYDEHVVNNAKISYNSTASTKLGTIESGADVNNISDINATDLTDGGDTTLHDHVGIDENTSARHAQSHAVASHNDTTGTGAELNELTDGSETTLHTHAASGGASGDMESIRLRCESGQTADGTASTAIQWDNLDFKDTDFTHSTSVNNSRITLGSTARYLVTGSINYHGTTDSYRLTSEVTAKINDTTWLPVRYNGGYVRATSGADELAIPFSFIVEATAGDFIEILTKRISDTSGDGTVDGGSNISITRLQGAKGAKGDKGDTGADGADGSGAGLYNAYVKVSDTKTSGTSGGDFQDNAWRTRILNSIDADTESIASLSSNSVTVPAGEYVVSCSAPGHRCDAHQARLIDSFNSSILIIGTSEKVPSGYNISTQSVMKGVITVLSDTTLKIEHRCASDRLVDGLGYPSGWGDEVYTILELWRL